MKIYAPDTIRNIVLVGNKGVGKTSFCDALVFVGGANTRIGRVDEGTSFLDTDPQEIKRKQTIASKVIPLEWRGHKINILDTPGFPDFWGETIGAMWVADVVVAVVDAAGGVPAHLKRLYTMARQWRKPVAFLLTRLDHPDADFEGTIESLKGTLGARTAHLAIPLGFGREFRGVIDLLDWKTYTTEKERTTVNDLPAELRETVETARTEIMDDVAETEPELMEKYLGGTVLNHEELHHGLAKGIEEGTIAPICCGSAATLGGVEAFLQLVVDWFPAPTEAPSVQITLASGEPEARRPDLAAPLTAQVFKSTSDPGIGDICFFRVFSGQMVHGDDIFNASKRAAERVGHLFVMRGRERMEVERVAAGDIAAAAKLKSTGIGDTLCAKQRAGTCPPIPFPQPMIALAVKAKTKADQDKLGAGLQKMMTLDPTFRMHIDHEFNETVVEGMGEIHLETILERLRDRFGVEIEIGKPRIPYRERLLKSVKVQGKYKKQSGGRGQYGDCWLEVTPMAIGAGYRFESKIFGGAIPAKYLPAIEKGVKEAMAKGWMAGYPVVDCQIRVVDGSYHDVDSSDMAFHIAGSMAFKKAEEDAGGQLVEPIMNVEVTIPSNFVGDVSGDFSSRRGRLQGMDAVDDTTAIRAQVPLAELYKYASALRAMTSGAGSYTMQFSHYEVVPGPVAQKIIAEAKALREEQAKAKA